MSVMMHDSMITRTLKIGSETSRQQLILQIITDFNTLLLGIMFLIFPKNQNFRDALKKAARGSFID